MTVCIIVRSKVGHGLNIYFVLSIYFGLKKLVDILSSDVIF